MILEIITKKDIQSLEGKINELVASFQPDEIIAPEIFYSINEVSEKLKVPFRAIKIWLRKGLIEYCQINGTILFSDQSLQKFMAKYSIERRTIIVNRLKPISHNNLEKMESCLGEKKWKVDYQDCNGEPIHTQEIGFMTFVAAEEFAAINCPKDRFIETWEVVPVNPPKKHEYNQLTDKVPKKGRPKKFGQIPLSVGFPGYEQYT